MKIEIEHEGSRLGATGKTGVFRKAPGHSKQANHTFAKASISASYFAR
jgi:hypothetical protein